MNKWMRAQQMELEHWQRTLRQPANSDDAVRLSRAIWSRFGLPAISIEWMRFVDIGAGPTGRLACFANPHTEIVAIDPLWNEYKRLPGSIWNCYSNWFAKPAEEEIDALLGWADMTCCVNCLDHCQTPAAVLANMLRFTRHGGVGFLSVDVSAEPEEMHPSRMTAEATEDLLIATGWTIQDRMRGRAYPRFDGDEVIAWDAGWSPGFVAHHWWLRRP